MTIKKVLLRAPLLTNSGYGVHSRQIFSWLNSRKDVDLSVECLSWGRTSWIVNEDYESGLIKKIMHCSKPVQPGSYDITFQVQLPDEWDNTLGRKNIGVSAIVETDKCRPEWVEHCNKMDMIIVPSTFTKNVIKRSGYLTKKIIVVPEWFDSTVDNKSVVAKQLNDERYKNIKKDFNILMIGTLTSQLKEDDRKNLENSIKWALEEFKNEKDVGLVIKTSLGKGTTADKKMCLEHLKRMLGGITDKRPPVYFVHGNMKNEEISALYNHKNIKVYATATRGEGYGLPIIEAAASGLPIVATNWSGHLEFLNKDYFYPVDYSLVEINDTKVDGRIFDKGFKWANPSEQDFKLQLRKVYDDYNSAKEKAKLLKKQIHQKFNDKSIKRLYDEIFEEVSK